MRKCIKRANDVAFDEITITSSFKLHLISANSPGFEIEDLPNVKVKASKVNGFKCQRCWKYEDKLINDEICNRCNDAIIKLVKITIFIFLVIF